MAPVWRIVADGAEYPKRELNDPIASRLGLTGDDLAKRLPKGKLLLVDRVEWAVTYLHQAGLLSRPRRGVIQITERGREVLKAHPDRVDNTVLKQFSEFQDFIRRSRDQQKLSAAATYESAGVSPRERVAAAVEEANDAVAADLLQRVRTADPSFLEHLVLSLLTAMGYGGPTGAVWHLGDSGVDGVIRQDPLGLDLVYVQAKRFAADRSVGWPDIQAFAGALHGAQADRGIFVTTSSFTADARIYAERVNARLVLIDGSTSPSSWSSTTSEPKNRSASSSSASTRTSSRTAEPHVVRLTGSGKGTRATFVGGPRPGGRSAGSSSGRGSMRHINGRPFRVLSKLEPGYDRSACLYAPVSALGGRFKNDRKQRRVQSRLGGPHDVPVG